MTISDETVRETLALEKYEIIMLKGELYYLKQHIYNCLLGYTLTLGDEKVSDKVINILTKKYGHIESIDLLKALAHIVKRFDLVFPDNNAPKYRKTD